MRDARGLFVYGTLRHLPLLETLVGGPVQAVNARLAGHHVVCWPGIHNPYLEAASGADAHGLFLTGLTDKQRFVLDTYEVPFGYYPKHQSVILGDGSVLLANVYFPDPSVVRTDSPWEIETWVADHGAVAVAAAAEIAAHDPPLDAEAMGRQWGMIMGRAHAKVRASASERPAEVRYAPTFGDSQVALRGSLAGGFFKLAGMTARHRRFDGVMSEPLLRETFVGVDAALILPYDAARDRVLLVEQWRPGPAWRGDPNPWALEPVAGIVDAGESPEAAARREGAEEAGVAFGALELMFQMYPSPGSTTDAFYCFVGAVDLPSLEVGHGGLANEHEDLRLHVMTLDDAIMLTETGEANAGPLIAMLLWLWRHRARLRGA